MFQNTPLGKLYANFQRKRISDDGEEGKITLRLSMLRIYLRRVFRDFGRKIKMNLTYKQISAMLLIVFSFTISAALAQDSGEQKSSRDFCSRSNFSYSGKTTVKEIRETTFPAPNLLTVDGQQHGSISVVGANRSDVLVRACIITAGDTENEAHSMGKNIRIETGSLVKAANTPPRGWMVLYEIYVPRRTNLNLTAYHGGIGISGVEGAMEFKTVHGGLSLSDVGGNVRGRTIHGGVSAVLSGNHWKGGGLDLETMHGGVYLSMPKTYAANVQTGTLHGTFYSNLKDFQSRRKEQLQALRINQPFNGGGTGIRVVTTYGAVQINGYGKTQ